MNKKDLRDGDRLTTKDGEINYFDEDFLEYYNDDLTYNQNYTPLDIVKVERIQFKEFKGYDWIDSDEININLTYQTIWEREEQLKTLEEVAQEMFGWSEEEFMKNFNVFREKELQKLLKEQPKKIEPLYFNKKGTYYNEEIDILNKINEIVEVINNGRNN